MVSKKKERKRFWKKKKQWNHIICINVVLWQVKPIVEASIDYILCWSSLE